MRKITFGTGCWLRLGLATFSVPVEDGKACSGRVLRSKDDAAEGNHAPA
jgi:hypothetical protein